LAADQWIGGILLAWLKLNRVLFALILLGLAGGGIALFSAMTTELVRARDSSADRVDDPARLSGVVALGRIEPVSEIINLGSGVASDRLESLLVSRGDPVKKGDILGYLNSYAEQIAQRDYYKAQLDEAERRLKAEISLNQSRIEAAQIHQKQVLEVSPLRIAAQEATIASLEAKAANDRDILDSRLQLYSRGASSRRLQDDQKAMVLQSDANLTAAKARLAELRHQFEIDRLDAETQIQVARAQLDRQVAEIPIASLRRQIALAETRARSLTLYAPIDGRILNVKVKPGENVESGPILTMGNTAAMRAVAEVYETDISRVRLGQSATITSLALPQPVTGKVARIGSMVFKNDVLNVDPAARADARVVEVWIDLDDAASTQQLTNLTVNVAININPHDVSIVSTDRP
jgi:HlyD family secretion protein